MNIHKSQKNNCISVLTYSTLLLLPLMSICINNFHTVSLAHNASTISSKNIRTSHSVTIALIDTGIDLNHPSLKDHFVNNSGNIGWDFCNNAPMSNYDLPKNETHATRCAEIILANAPNVNIKILPIKILDPNNSSDNGSGSIKNAIKAIKYATSKGADICNISWGFYKYDFELQKAMEESNMLFITAAGNDSLNLDKKPLYPAAYKLSNIICVASSNKENKLSKFSNYGDCVDILAPGENIYSNTINSYGSMSGTSVSVPQVSATAAIAYSAADNIYPNTVKHLILSSARHVKISKKKLHDPKVVAPSNLKDKLNQLLVDTVAPSIKIKTSISKGTPHKFKVTLNVKDSGGSKLCSIKYANGNHPISYFKNGTIGTSINSPFIFIKNKGTYTFFASDYAGNSSCIVYNIK